MKKALTLLLICFACFTHAQDTASYTLKYTWGYPVVPGAQLTDSTKALIGFDSLYQIYTRNVRFLDLKTYFQSGFRDTGTYKSALSFYQGNIQIHDTAQNYVQRKDSNFQKGYITPYQVSTDTGNHNNYLCGIPFMESYVGATAGNVTGAGTSNYTTYWTGTHTLGSIAPGSSGQILQSQGAGSPPIYAQLSQTQTVTVTSLAPNFTVTTGAYFTTTWTTISSGSVGTITIPSSPPDGTTMILVSSTSGAFTMAAYSQSIAWYGPSVVSGTIVTLTFHHIGLSVGWWGTIN